MSIADQINRLNNAKAAIKQSIINKGVEVSDSALLDEYPALIDSIEAGSGEGGGDPFYEDFYNMKTNNGTSFQNLFYNYAGYELDVSKLKTNNVSTMNSMFRDCYGLQNIIGIDNMNVSNVIDISCMFYNCNSLQSLDISKWDTSNVTSMLQVFCTCNQLQQLDLSGWDVHNVTNMDSMFSQCNNLTSLDVSDWDTSKVNNMYGLFGYNYSLQNIIGIEDLDVSNVDNMNDMFNGCNGLQSLDLSKWDTSNVTSMGGMFSYMQSGSLPKIDLSSFNTKKVTNMNYMFNWCIYLQELDIRNFELVHEDGTQAEMYGMFEGCNSLRILRLDNCSNATINKIINESSMPQEQIYDNDTGEYVNRIIYCKEENAAGLSAPYGWEFVFVSDEEPEEPTMPLYVPGEFQGNTDITEVRTMVNESHDSLENMFFACSNLTSVNTEDWNVSNVTNMHSVFDGCNKLASLNLNNWNTSNVTNMFNMFAECKALQSLDLSNWNTSKVTAMNRMFYECNNLTSLNLSNWDMTIIEDTNSYTGFMFAYCYALQELRLDNCSNDTINKIITSYAFPTNAIDGVTRTIYCKEENIGDLVAPTNWVFSYVTEEEPEVPVDPSAGDIPLYVPGEFQDNTEITEARTMINESHDDLSYMFSGCTNLVSVNTDGWDISNVTSMGYMFSGCTSLTQLNLSNFNTSNIGLMSSMFENCTSLTSLNISNWDASSIFAIDWDMRDMFLGCTSLQELRLDNCSNDTINKIIKSIGFPTNAIDGTMRKIYCKEANVAGLTAPTNWVFEYIG